MREPRKSIPDSNQVQRLGRNINGYFGETIDIAAVLADCTRAARGTGWKVEEIRVDEGLELLVFKRGPNGSGDDTQPARGTSVYISAGIHGDEPAGPLAVRGLLEQNAFPSGLALTILPCLNPVGFRLNRRENAEGLDLNRQYLDPTARETQAHIGWLEHQPSFDLCLCLHEDWESHGFYVYELNPDNRPSLAEGITERVGAVCPIDRSEIIEGRPACNGIIRPSIDPATRPQWPESFFLLTRKTRLSYTLEAPSDFPLSVRVEALSVGVKTSLERLAS